jgi:hypothetical protein
MAIAVMQYAAAFKLLPRALSLSTPSLISSHNFNRISNSNLDFSGSSHRAKYSHLFAEGNTQGERKRITRESEDEFFESEVIITSPCYVLPYSDSFSV